MYEKDQNFNLEKKIKELSDIINKNNEEKNSFDDILLEKVSDTVKAEEIKSFLFLDSIIQVFIFCNKFSNFNRVFNCIFS